MHFTYDEQPKADLQQGDLVRRTSEVEQLLQAVHPHYHLSQNYRYFLVLTQSCDLVRRDGKPCNGRYITIAAVRPIKLVVERELQKLQHTEVERSLGFCSIERQGKLRQFMERLLNNNEEEYFYLHREPLVGLVEDHCAFLHLSIALKAHVHYQTLLDARILSLNVSFQHKLGYLVGNLYSRVGTEDWFDKNDKTEIYQELTQRPIKDPDLVLWLEKEMHRKVVDKLKEIEAPSPVDLKTAIAEVSKSKELRKDEMLGLISKEFMALNVPEDVVKKACNRLGNRGEFTAKIR